MKYNNHNGAIHWLVLTSIKVVLEHLSPTLAVFQILYIYILPDIL